MRSMLWGAGWQTKVELLQENGVKENLFPFLSLNHAGQAWQAEIARN
jgi:hypothetical protein